MDGSVGVCAYRYCYYDGIHFFVHIYRELQLEHDNLNLLLRFDRLSRSRRSYLPTCCF